MWNYWVIRVYLEKIIKAKHFSPRHYQKVRFQHSNDSYYVSICFSQSNCFLAVWLRECKEKSFMFVHLNLMPWNLIDRTIVILFRCVFVLTKTSSYDKKITRKLFDRKVYFLKLKKKYNICFHNWFSFWLVLTF